MALPLALETVVLAASSTESPIFAWDMQTGVQFKAYKTCSSSRGGVIPLGQRHLVAAQSGKGTLQFWSWNKEQLSHRSFTLEPLTCLCSTRDGALCVGGSGSGTVYIWEVGTGRLLRSWPAHYKAISGLSFSADDSLLVTGGHDTEVHTWVVMDLVDAAASASATPSPLFSWSEHTLPVTQVLCASGGGGAACLVVTAAGDCSVKIWTLAHGGMLLRTIVYPTTINAVILDPSETSLYAGGADSKIYVHPVSSTASEQPHSGPPSGDVLGGHTAEVTALACSVDGLALISGSEDCTVRVWDMQSRHCVRTLTHSGGPVTCVLALTKSRLQEECQQPRIALSVPQFAKYGTQGTASERKPWEGPLVTLEPTEDDDKWTRGEWEELLGAEAVGWGTTNLRLVDEMREGKGTLGGATHISHVESSEDECARLRRELEQAKSEAARWQAMHAELHSFTMEQVLDGQ